jgi:hypothetical protein
MVLMTGITTSLDVLLIESTSFKGAASRDEFKLLVVKLEMAELCALLLVALIELFFESLVPFFL